MRRGSASGMSSDDPDNLYFVRPSALGQGDAVVHFYDHDEGTCRALVTSLKLFLNAPRSISL